MQDVVEAEVAKKAPGKGKAKAKGGAAKGPELQIARMLVRAMWQQEWTAANPDKPLAERSAAWTAVRQERQDAAVPGLRRALMSLKRAGVTMAITPRAGKAEEA